MFSLTGCGRLWSNVDRFNLTNPQVFTATVLSGSTTVNHAGVYGTKTIESPANFPGSRIFQTSWVDPSGNFWIFGGQGLDSIGASGELNDLWKYSPASNQWTWVSGSNVINQSGVYGTKNTGSTSNFPGARDSTVRWIDAGGNLWIFGGGGYDSGGSQGWLDDLWKFDPANSQWTWVSGNTTVGQTGVYGTQNTGSTSNFPGGRYGGLSWIDTGGHFWIFGGAGYDSSGTFLQLNDLWSFNPTNGQWTWVSGSDLGNQSGTYGTLGLGSSANIPGSRDYSSSWTDLSGNLWLYGGYGNDMNGSQGYLSDLWEFSIVGGKWTWASGSNLKNQTGVWGVRGVESGANFPGGRHTPLWWTDARGNFWLMGGNGIDSTNNYGLLNDMWMYNPLTNTWTWEYGGNIESIAGIYGTEGIPNSQNYPGARYRGTSWSDSQGNFWIFGGNGFDSGGTQGALNDLWKLTP